MRIKQPNVKTYVSPVLTANGGVFTIVHNLNSLKIVSLEVYRVDGGKTLGDYFHYWNNSTNAYNGSWYMGSMTANQIVIGNIGGQNIVRLVLI